MRELVGLATQEPEDHKNCYLFSKTFTQTPILGNLIQYKLFLSAHKRGMPKVRPRYELRKVMNSF